MRVLDIDLDFFQSEIIEYDDLEYPTKRPQAVPWMASSVIRFLKENCGLSKQNKKPGKFIIEHSEVFTILRELVLKERIITPLDLVHVDAHADLGYKSDWAFISTTVLQTPLEKRKLVENFHSRYSYFNSRNYLLYLIACELLSSITYVVHPNRKTLDAASPDIFKDNNYNNKIIQLKNYGEPFTSPSEFDKIYKKKYTLERPVNFDVVWDYNTYHSEEPFDYIFLAQSPYYTDPRTDSLISVIREFIDETLL